jgi:glycerol uptake facilitator protein
MSVGKIFVSEFIGTAVLIAFISGGVGANMLKKSGSSGGGWLQVVLGVAGGIFTANSIASGSGANLNPSLSLAFAVDGRISWAQLPVYVVAQMLGGAFGALISYLAYKKQFDTNPDNSDSVHIFATYPLVRSPFWNVVTEAIGTFMLVLWVLSNPGMTGTSIESLSLGNSALGFLGVTVVMIGIANCFGGPTNWALNPARDLGPRIMYAFVLPIPKKGSGEWWYSWVPVVGPTIGAVLAVPVAGLLA